MRKELIWVVIIGIFFGLAIAFGVWRINSTITKTNPDFPGTIPSSQNPGNELKITLNSPENNNVVRTSPVTVSGITRPLTWTVVSGEMGDYILQSDENGLFAQDVELTPGINRIILTAFDTGGSQSVQKVIVVYSSAFQPVTVVPTTSSDNATGDAAIREKVAQKVAAAMSQPKAYLGLVTDITSTTIQTKTPESQIEQIAIGDEKISVINTKGTNNKAVKLTDIAIGDFIVAMGYVNGNQVLQAQRILITDPLENSGLVVSIGKVSNVSKNSFTVSDIKSGENSLISPTKNTSLLSFANGKTTTIKIASIKTEGMVIYTTDTSITPPFVRTIFDI